MNILRLTAAPDVAYMDEHRNDIRRRYNSPGARAEVTRAMSASNLEDCGIRTELMINVERAFRLAIADEWRSEVADCLVIARRSERATDCVSIWIRLRVRGGRLAGTRDEVSVSTLDDRSIWQRLAVWMATRSVELSRTSV